MRQEDLRRLLRERGEVSVVADETHVNLRRSGAGCSLFPEESLDSGVERLLTGDLRGICDESLRMKVAQLTDAGGVMTIQQMISQLVVSMGGTTEIWESRTTTIETVCRRLVERLQVLPVSVTRYGLDGEVDATVDMTCVVKKSGWTWQDVVAGLLSGLRGRCLLRAGMLTYLFIEEN